MTLKQAIYLVVQRLHFEAEGWPAYLDVITEPSYTNSDAARARLAELAALYEREDNREALAALGLGAKVVGFYLRDVALVQEM